MLGNANGLIYGLAVVIPGSTMLANEWLFGHEFAVVVNFAANFAGSYAYAKIAATSPSVFILTKNGTQFGTLTFTGTAGVFSSTATSFAIGDTLELIAPASPDTTLAKLAITLYGTM